MRKTDAMCLEYSWTGKNAHGVKQRIGLSASFFSESKTGYFGASKRTLS